MAVEPEVTEVTEIALLLLTILFPFLRTKLLTGISSSEEIWTSEGSSAEGRVVLLKK